MSIELQPCPFCGKKVAKCDTIINIEMIDETNELYEFWADNYSVVCDFNKGGCGATGGNRGNRVEAIEAWNRRAPNEY